MATNLSGNPDHVRHYMSGNPDSVRHYLSGNPDHVRHYVSDIPGSARYYASGNPDGTSKTIHCARAVIPLRSPAQAGRVTTTWSMREPNRSWLG